jgi:hypothetical protein
LRYSLPKIERSLSLSQWCFLLVGQTRYKQSSILTVAYGRQADNALALGSLDLLDPQRKFEILAITAKAAEGMGESEKETWSSLPHASFDVVYEPALYPSNGPRGGKTQCSQSHVCRIRFECRGAAIDGQGYGTVDKGYKRSRQCGRGVDFSCSRRPQAQGGWSKGISCSMPTNRSELST